MKEFSMQRPLSARVWGSQYSYSWHSPTSINCVVRSAIRALPVLRCCLQRTKYSRLRRPLQHSIFSMEWTTQAFSSYCSALSAEAHKYSTHKCRLHGMSWQLTHVYTLFYQSKFRNLTSDYYTESCCWRSVNQEMRSRRCDTAEMCDMRIWRVGIARNAMFFHSFVASLAGKVSS